MGRKNFFHALVLISLRVLIFASSTNSCFSSVEMFVALVPRWGQYMVSTFISIVNFLHFAL